MNTASSLALALALGLPCSAGAVELSTTGQGQALIYPIYSVEAGNDTAIHVTNGDNFPTTAKVRILDGVTGKAVHSFNLYLDAYDVWTGVLTRSGDGVRLVSDDDSCTLPRLPAGGLELGSGARPELAPRARVGLIEIIETGGPTHTDLPDPIRTSILDLYHGVGGCERFSEAFTEGGIWSQDSTAGLGVPRGRLYGSVTMTNVMNGHQAGLDATALLDFSRHPRQTRPDDDQPTLGQSETTEARMQGTVLPFKNGAEAVTALLTRLDADGDFAYGAGLNAETDWVITFPTKAYLNAMTTPDLIGESFSPFVTTPDEATGKTCEQVEYQYLDRQGKERRWSSIKLCAITNLVGVGTSDIMGGRYVRTSISGLRSETGWLQILMLELDAFPEWPTKRNLFPTNGEPRLEGLGFIGFAITRIQNGDVGGLLSNYVSVKRLTSSKSRW